MDSINAQKRSNECKPVRWAITLFSMLNGYALMGMPGTLVG
jgi:hypothetical protein